ncbi:unnamed protein product, partial [marine sediment metagenome]
YHAAAFEIAAHRAVQPAAALGDAEAFACVFVDEVNPAAASAGAQLAARRDRNKRRGRAVGSVNPPRPPATIDPLRRQTEGYAPNSHHRPGRRVMATVPPGPNGRAASLAQGRSPALWPGQCWGTPRGRSGAANSSLAARRTAAWRRLGSVFTVARFFRPGTGILPRGHLGAQEGKAPRRRRLPAGGFLEPGGAGIDSACRVHKGRRTGNGAGPVSGAALAGAEACR